MFNFLKNLKKSRRRENPVKKAWKELVTSTWDHHPGYGHSVFELPTRFRAWAIEHKSRFGGLETRKNWDQALIAFGKHWMATQNNLSADDLAEETTRVLYLKAISSGHENLPELYPCRVIAGYTFWPLAHIDAIRQTKIYKEIYIPVPEYNKLRRFKDIEHPVSSGVTFHKFPEDLKSSTVWPPCKTFVTDLDPIPLLTMLYSRNPPVEPETTGNP